MPPSVAQKRADFRRFHEAGCFLMPNPWDSGSARYLQSLGFKAIASSSAGFAWTQGRSDNAVTRDMVLNHIRDLAAAVDIPVNADFEGGFAHDAEGVAANVKLAVATGVAGLSIEDFNGNRDDPLYHFAHAVDRIRAARAAIDETGASVVLTARTEGYVFGRPDLRETINRLTAFAEAGADCVFAPGLRNPDDIRAVVQAVTPTPVNVVGTVPGFSVALLANLGVRRISTASALPRAAWAGFMAAAKEMAETGTMDFLARTVSHTELNKLFS